MKIKLYRLKKNYYNLKKDTIFPYYPPNYTIQWDELVELWECWYIMNVKILNLAYKKRIYNRKRFEKFPLIVKEIWDISEIPLINWVYRLDQLDCDVVHFKTKKIIWK